MVQPLSPVRQAIQNRDLERLEKELQRQVSPQVLVRAFDDLLEPAASAFRSKALALLLANGLKPGAISAVPTTSAVFSNHRPYRVDPFGPVALRAPYAWATVFDTLHVPLAGRAALADATLLEALLKAGADPRATVEQRKGESFRLQFGSAWGSALALTGRDLGKRSLEVLCRHDTGSWEHTPELVRDVLRALVHPGTVKAPPASEWGVKGARQAWDVVGGRLSGWSREQWGQAWTDSVAWTSLSSRSQDCTRLVLLAQVLSPVALAGLFDASRKANWDLRGLALEAALGGDEGCWNALEKANDLLRMQDLPNWGQMRYAWTDAADRNYQQVVPLDGLGWMLLRVRWPLHLDEEGMARADAWYERMAKEGDPAPSGRTLAQWRMMGREGALVRWMARHPDLFAPHPETGRTPWHENRALEQVLRHPSLLQPDWLAVDNQGEEAGATAIAMGSNDPVQPSPTTKALLEGRLWANGMCLGRHASTWAASHPQLQKAYRQSCQDRELKPPRGIHAKWRLHTATQAMSPVRVRTLLERLDEPGRQQALLEVDKMGRTPLLWWAHARPRLRKDKKIDKTWQGRAERVFGLLAPPGLPLWKKGMSDHPFFAIHAPSRLGYPVDWSAEITDRLAQDLGRALKDESSWDVLLPRLVSHLSRQSVSGTDPVWDTWRPGSEGRRRVLVGMWNHMATADQNKLDVSRVLIIIHNLRKGWERAGCPLGAQDLAHPDVPAAFEKFKERFPGEAQTLAQGPLFAATLQAHAMEQALPTPSPRPGASSGMRF